MTWLLFERACSGKMVSSKGPSLETPLFTGVFEQKSAEMPVNKGVLFSGVPLDGATLCSI